VPAGPGIVGREPSQGRAEIVGVDVPPNRRGAKGRGTRGARGNAATRGRAAGAGGCETVSDLGFGRRRGGAEAGDLD
jgi:hypothetical protein